jgi:hypothetical protein
MDGRIDTDAEADGHCTNTRPVVAAAAVAAAAAAAAAFGEDGQLRQPTSGSVDSSSHDEDTAVWPEAIISWRPGFDRTQQTDVIKAMKIHLF